MSDVESLNRRQMLQFAAVVFARHLAGCGTVDAGEELQTADERIRSLAESAPLRMQFDGSTATECRAWQKQFRHKLQTLLGPYECPETWNTVRERKVDCGDHVREELLLQARGVPTLPVCLLTPKSAMEKRRAGIVAIHGHGGDGYNAVVARGDAPGILAQIKEKDYDYGRQLVRRGFVVVAPCLTPFGRRLGDRDRYKNNDPCAITFLRMQILGKLLMAENLRDALWSVELLARSDSVDPDRIGCVGLSYGGRMTMLTAAMEPRIKSAVIAGALNVMQERIATKPYKGGCQIIPGLLQYGDVPEIASLIAPRRSLWVVGKQDKLIPRDWADLGRKRMRRAYHALNADDQLEVAWCEGGHRWNSAAANATLDEVLKP